MVEDGPINSNAGELRAEQHPTGEVLKNIPPPKYFGGRGRNKSKVRTAVEQLEVGDSFEMGPYTSGKVAEKMRAKVIRAMVHHKRRPNSKDDTYKKLATRIRRDEDNGQFYLGAWRTQ